MIYNKMGLSLDAKEILMHLNDMGYRNISSSQLKEFMKDLRKLIKYEERLGLNQKEDLLNQQNRETKTNQNANHLNRKLSKNIIPPVAGSKFIEENKPKIYERNCTKHDPPKESQKDEEKGSTKPSSRCKSARKPKKANDPVELYQYYKKEWDRFKKYLPGENSHNELRWEIKKKLNNIEK